GSLPQCVFSCIMGSFRRPRPRFMSSPVLSDLARFHASTPALQISNITVWNRVQSAVIKVFKGASLQNNELYTLNESIRWLLKTEMGSFITECYACYCNVGFISMVTSSCVPKDGNQLNILAYMWDQFFTETLPTLQAIFYPVQGQELTVRQMALLAFRDLVLLKLHLEETLGNATSIPPSVTQMLLILQGIHESAVPSSEYHQLEHLVEIVVSPYTHLYSAYSFLGPFLSSESCHLRSSATLLGDQSQPEITITQHHSFLDSSSLSPLVEQEGEAYLEKVGGVRRHTVANAHSDVHLLSISNKMHAGMEKDSRGEEEQGVIGFLVPMSRRHFSNQVGMAESPNGSEDNGFVRQWTCETIQDEKLHDDKRN
uniref:Proline rich 5 like n=1 Tax=Amphilophus citrinellus TaxID=61819 RepID=A0A3Q0SGC2_AMPCI